MTSKWNFNRASLVLDTFPLLLIGSPAGATRKGAVAGGAAVFTVDSQRPSEHQPESEVPKRERAEARPLHPAGSWTASSLTLHTCLWAHPAHALVGSPCTRACGPTHTHTHTQSHTQRSCHVRVDKLRHPGHARSLSPGAQPCVPVHRGRGGAPPPCRLSP